MIEGKQIAAQVGERVLEASRLLNEAIFVVQQGCSEAELHEFRRAVGQVLGEMLLSVVNPLCQRHQYIWPEGFNIS